MSLATSPPRPTATATPATLRQLALVDAKRYARHPLFVFGLVASLAVIIWAATLREPGTLALVIVPSFFLGLLGLVVAHRLTTSMRGTRELVDSMPLNPRRRTLSLCLACGVPMLAGLVCSIAIVLSAAAFPPVEPVPGAPTAWFGDAPWPDVLATLLALGTVAALGGPLLGVLIATWAPFRGSALVAVVVIFLVCEAATHWSMPWRMVLPWSVPVDDHVTDGVLTSSTFVPGASMVWFLVYALLMCGLAAVGAMLRDPVGRRPLLWTAAGLVVAASGALVLTVT